MSECEFGRKLDAYHDGELAAEERAAVQAHLGECSSCASELRQLQDISRLFVTGRAPELSAAARKRLHNRVVAFPQRSILRLAEFLTAAAAAVLVVSSALLSQASNTPSSGVITNDLEQTIISMQSDTSVTAESRFAAWAAEDLTLGSRHD